MNAMRTLLTIVAVACASGCQTAPPKDSLEAKAIATATRHAQFDMNCGTASASLLSHPDVQPNLQGVQGRTVGGTEFTVGAFGCNQQGTYLVICPGNGGDCFVASGRLVM